MFSGRRRGQEKTSRSTTSPSPPGATTIPRNVSKITVEIPSHKIETADFFPVDPDVDVEKARVDPRRDTPRDPLRSPAGPRRAPQRQSNRSSLIGWSVEPITSDDDDDDGRATQSRSQRLFNAITKHAGSRYVLLATVLLIVAWALVGAVAGPSDIWQIAMQNASSVQVYLTDILLIRQQHIGSRHLLTVLSKMQSRERTHARLLRHLPARGPPGPAFRRRAVAEAVTPADALTDHLPPEAAAHSRSQELFDTACRVVARGLGSVWAYGVYWAGIVVWMGCGSILHYADTWQLYINTAVAVGLTFTSVFLQNRQQQQEDTLDRALRHVATLDAEIEARLRAATGDRPVARDVVVIEAPRVGWVCRGIDLFAIMMGSFVGLVITLGFLVAWLVIGPLLRFNADWWLVLGTFTGLVGFLDGFVLRNVYAREAGIVSRELAKSTAATSDVLARLRLRPPAAKETRLALPARVSRAVGDWCATPTVSVLSFLFVLALLGIASAMRWTTTAQLICNTPTMIVEGFLLLVLIEAHCMADEEKGRHLKNVLQRRMLFNRYRRECVGTEAGAAETGRPWPVVHPDEDTDTSRSSSSSSSARSSPRSSVEQTVHPGV